MNKFLILAIYLFFSTVGYAQISDRFVPPSDIVKEVESDNKISGDSLKLLIDRGEIGDTLAQIFLAKEYYSGIRLNEDNEKAFYWFSKASELNCKESFYFLGEIYYNGYGINQDYLKSHFWFEKAANFGDNKAMMELGLMYDNGKGITQDHKKAKYWYEKAANLGNSDAMNNLAYCYANGEGVTKDFIKAKYWNDKAAILGNSLSMANLGEFYEKGLGVTKDYKKAKYWYEKAAKLENSDAINSLGNLYSKGFGVVKDCQEAKYWYEMGAKLGDANSMYNLGELYNMNTPQGAYLVIQDNCDEIKDNKLAIEWHERSAQSGNIISLFKLGEINEAMGKYDKAKEWYEKASENDLVGAMIKLGNLYADGRGVNESYKDASYWYQEASDKGSSYASFLLSELQEKYSEKLNGMSLEKRKQKLLTLSYIDYSNGWIYLTETKNDIKLFKEVSKDGYSNVKVWVKSIPKSSQLTSYRNEYSSYFKSATIKQKIVTQLSLFKSLYIIDCSENKLGEKSSVYYTKDGSVIYNDNNELFNEYDMDEVIPETIGEDILKTICEYYEKYGK